MPKISVIVPVYKVEKYLRRCVDSILSQTYLDFELLLVDDGSPDNSGKICDEYAAIDPRVSVFHKPNGGVSSARNLGLENAQGEWVTFIDSDDWVNVDYLNELLKGISSDLSVMSFVLEETDENWGDLPEGIYNGLILREFLEKYSDTVHLTAPWGKLFRRNLLQKHCIKFSLNLNTGEDTIFVLHYLCHIKSIHVLEKNSYHYWREGNSLSTDLSVNNREYELFCSLYKKYAYEMHEILGTDPNIMIGRACQGPFIKQLKYIISNDNSFSQKQKMLESLFDNDVVKVITGHYRLSKGRKAKILNFLIHRNSFGLAVLYLKLLAAINYDLY